MRYRVLATDYDGTIATDGAVTASTLAALTRVKESGRRLVLVTGRILEELAGIFPEMTLFDRIVAENGAVLYNPSTKENRPLAEPPKPALLEWLKARGVSPILVGQCITATFEPYDRVMLDAVRELGLECQIIFNKGAVMLLPSGVNKASGLEAAMKDLGVSSRNAVGIGDAENDHAFLTACECGVAVANALPMLKDTADFTLDGDHGAGAEQLCEMLIKSDLRGIVPRPRITALEVGIDGDGAPVAVPPYGTSVLLCGSSQGGKSTLATSLLERISEAGYQFCVIDPEGDYEAFPNAVALGSQKHAPSLAEIDQMLDQSQSNLIVNLISAPLDDRPRLFVTTLSRIQELRAHYGRPHWLLIDEAHHVLPAQRDASAQTLKLNDLQQTVFVTLMPREMSTAALSGVGVVMGIGADAQAAIREFAALTNREEPSIPGEVLDRGRVIVWLVDSGRAPFVMSVRAPATARKRHSRKYAQGELPPDRSFWFRGREDKLKLRAQNLITFTQLADGVDDDTWMYHLQEHHYSRWFEEMIKDPTLAREARAVEESAEPPDASRARIRELVERYYTLPATT